MPLVIFLLLSSFIQAQSWQTWNWTDYKMKFKAPDNLSIQENDGNGFKGSNSAIALSIFPRKGEGLTYDGMKSALITWASQISLSYSPYNTDGDPQPIYLSDINGYWGCAIDGTRNGFSSSILLLVDPDYPDISFYIAVDYSSAYYHDAVSIIKSFEPN